jgi:hypothetical protein
MNCPRCGNDTFNNLMDNFNYIKNGYPTCSKCDLPIFLQQPSQGMFEELDFIKTKSCKRETLLLYCKGNVKNNYDRITFYNDKTFSVYFKGKQDTKLILAMHQQIKELGWLD